MPNFISPTDDEEYPYKGANKELIGFHHQGKHMELPFEVRKCLKDEHLREDLYQDALAILEETAQHRRVSLDDVSPAIRMAERGEHGPLPDRKPRPNMGYEERERYHESGWVGHLTGRKHEPKLMSVEDEIEHFLETSDLSDEAKLVVRNAVRRLAPRHGRSLGYTRKLVEKARINPNEEMLVTQEWNS